jgi:hypothetical protein
MGKWWGIDMVRDAAVLELLTGNNTLLDTVLTGISVTQDSLWREHVELQFKARPDSDFSEINLRFIDVVDFEFFLEKADAFLDVCELKFLKLNDDSFYLTVDPDPSTLLNAGAKELDASDTDHYFVRARHIEVVVKKKQP